MSSFDTKTASPLDVGGTLVLPLSVDGYVGKALELQQVCEGTIGSSRG